MNSRHLMLSMAIGLSLAGCGGSNNDNTGGASNDPVLKESVRISNINTDPNDLGEPELLTAVNERAVDDQAEPFALR